MNPPPFRTVLSMELFAQAAENLQGILQETHGIQRLPVKFPRGDLLAYYFRLRRQGFTPRGARNCTWTHAQATEIRIPDHRAEELTAHYNRPGAYTGD